MEWLASLNDDEMMQTEMVSDEVECALDGDTKSE